MSFESIHEEIITDPENAASDLGHLPLYVAGPREYRGDWPSARPEGPGERYRLE